MKKNTIYYTTKYSMQMGFLLKKMKSPNVVETFCIAFDMATKKRKPIMDGYYYNSELNLYIEPTFEK